MFFVDSCLQRFSCQSFTCCNRFGGVSTELRDMILEDVLFGPFVVEDIWPGNHAHKKKGTFRSQRFQSIHPQPQPCCESKRPRR